MIWRKPYRNPALMKLADAVGMIAPALHHWCPPRLEALLRNRRTSHRQSNAHPRRGTSWSVDVNEITRILSAIDHGDSHAAEQLLPLIYDELRRLAAQKLAQEKPGQTLPQTETPWSPRLWRNLSCCRTACAVSRKWGPSSAARVGSPTPRGASSASGF